MEMTCSGTSEIVKVECPDYVNRICHQAGCPRFLSRVSKDRIDEVGQQLFRGACILNGDTEWFSGCLLYKGDKPVLQTGTNAVESMVTANDETRNSGAGRKHRWKGRSEFAGTTTEGLPSTKIQRFSNTKARHLTWDEEVNRILWTEPSGLRKIAIRAIRYRCRLES